jgi:hypothetical protein
LAESDSEKIQALFEKDLHLPEARRIWLKNPLKTDFENALERVKRLASKGKNTLLFFHYSGHGISKGGFIGLFGDSCFINFTTELNKHFEKYHNIWVVMAFDTCYSPLLADMRMDKDET